MGDGAPWIEEQFEDQFGANHSFLIDFYHVGEYLAAAAKEVGEVAGEAGRYRGLKDKMLADKAEEVIAELGSLRQEQPQKEAVEACHRYLGNRTAHLCYAEALAAGLPIGSGEVESGHRSRATEAAEETRSMVAQAERRKHGAAQNPTSQRPRGKSLAKTSRMKNTEKNHTPKNLALCNKL